MTSIKFKYDEIWIIMESSFCSFAVAAHKLLPIVIARETLEIFFVYIRDLNFAPPENSLPP